MYIGVTYAAGKSSGLDFFARLKPLGGCVNGTPKGKELDELKAWCDQQYGRRAEVARFVGVERQVVTNWLAGRQELAGEQVLALLEFLEARRGGSS